MEETAFFKRKRVVAERLLPYGFVKANGAYHLSTDILDGQFRLHVSVSEAGRVDSRVMDAASDEEYVLHRVSGAAGSFSGSVREACERVMLDVAEKCFETDIFKSEQARDLISHVRKTYGDELEYLWAKFPDNAVWRRRDTQKWYGALLTVSRRKLGINSDEITEIIDLRAEPAELEKLVDRQRFFPGWHMNKKNWYTIVLDGSVPLDRIELGLDESYRLALK